ncbi:MAG: hypothetical protein JST00_28580 [Deltaproteobacteria bacterium]|nr:hypothetical protein [Deltaproteobacteria bacterium]
MNPSRLRALVVVLVVGCAFASLGATCVDGVTPTCADDAGCGPINLDGSQDGDTSTTLPEASPDAGSDASADAPVDAADDVEDAADEI